MANTLAQSGAQSATFNVPTVDGSNGTLVAADWTGLPAGKLKSLLNKAYVSGSPAAPDFDLFFVAAADAGFSCSNLHSVGGVAHTDQLAWSLDGSGYPSMAIVTADVGTYFARLQTSYSASE